MIADCFEYVPGGKAIKFDVNIGKTSLGKARLHMLGIIAPKMASQLIGCGHPIQPCWNAEDESSSGVEFVAPLGQRGHIVLDMFEYLECTNCIETF